MEENVGRCACGDIEYRFKGDPINSVFCYCKECQTLTGSDKWFGLWVARDNFTITKGTPCRYSRVGNSGKDVHYLFCGRCSTAIGADITAGGFYSVSANTLKDNTFRPRMSIYASSAPSWALFTEDIPKFDVLPPGMGG